MTKKLPKTIQFFLPAGEPRGVRIAEITTRMVQAVLVPRSKLAEAAGRPELRNVGVYFLFGEVEESAKPQVYIGEAEECYKRVAQHNAGKDFWQTAVAMVSRTNSFTKAHARYLEWYSIAKAREVGRYALENGTAGGEPHVTEPMRADLMDAFETMSILVSALGYPIFDPRPQAPAEEVFYCTARGCEGRGQLVEDGFTVFAGSKAIKDLAPGAEQWIADSRKSLIAARVLAAEGDRLVFKEDYTFKTPSGAAIALTGRRASGWTVWKDKQGRTLDGVKRQAPADQAGA